MVSTRAHIREESGFTVIAVVALMAVAAIIMIAFSMTVKAAGDRASQRASRVLELPQIENAINTYQGGLQADTVGEANDFILPHSALLEARSTGDQVIPNNSAEIPTELRQVDGIYQSSQRLGNIPPEGLYTMKQVLPVAPGATGAAAVQRWGYWHLYRVELPDYDDVAQEGNLVAYFRGWIGSSESTSSRSRIVRVEFRPGRFADYQILTDGPLAFQAGAHIDGPVHSNGLSTSIYLTPPVAGQMIWNYGGLTCDPSAIVTTANGTISVPPECATARGGYVSFLRTQESFDRMSMVCDDSPSDTVYCFPPKTGVYTVRMSGNTAIVDGTGYPVSRMSGMLFRDDVEISGRTLGRLTIAAQRGDARTSAASITITGDVGISAGGSSLHDTLGLISEGDITVALNSTGNACAVSEINAAIVAMSGKLTIPKQWTTPTAQTGAPICNAPIRIAAAIASHDAPILTWSWSTTRRVGYTSRRYSWDERFRRNPPPFFPLTDQWQEAGYKEANSDCLTSRTLDSRCR